MSAELPEGRVELRVAGDDVDLAYVEDERVGDAEADGDLSARITLRLSEGLKARVEEGAAGEGVSVNTFIVRTLERGASIAEEPFSPRWEPPARLRHDLKGEPDMENTFETAGPVRLHVENEAGLVSISARETATTVVSLEADTPAAEELVEHSAVECRSSAGRHVVAVKIPSLRGKRFLRRDAVTVRVEVPEGSDVKVLVGSADVEITGSINTADLVSSSGDISTDDVAADAAAKTASGDITIGAVGGHLRVAHRLGGPALLERGRLASCSRPRRATWRSARPPTGRGQGDVGERAARRAVARRTDRQRLRRRARPGPRRGQAVRALRLGRRLGGYFRRRGPPRRRGDALGSRCTPTSRSPMGPAPMTLVPGPRVDLSVRSVSGNVEIGRAARAGGVRATPTYPKTIGKASRLAIMSATGVVGHTSTLFHCDKPVA